MRRRGSARSRDVAVVVTVLLVLGVLGGVLWSLVVTPAELTKLPAGDSMGEDQLGRQFGADAWYVVIAVLSGLVAGAGLSWWRSADPLVTSVALVAGAVLAAAVMAVTGHLLGPADPETVLATARLGARVPESLDVGTLPVTPLVPYVRDTASVYLAWPAGVLAGALLVLVGHGRENDDGAQTRRPGSAAMDNSGISVPPPR